MTMTAPLAITGFGSTSMLLWALAAVVPILIHLWFKRRYQVLPWAAVQFLLAAVRARARRIRLEQLILLAVRVGILLLLALALADPYLEQLTQLGPSLVARPRLHTVLVLDGSYSMAAAEAEQSRFEQARAAAVQIVSAANQGDAFTLVLLADPPQVIVSEPAFEPSDVIEEIDALRMPHGAAALPPTLAHVERILTAAHKRQKRLAKHRVCILTDLQQRTWSAAERPAVRQQLGRLAELATLELIDVGGGRGENLAVTGLQQSPPVVTPMHGVEFTAEVQNFGGQQRSAAVEFFLDGRRIHNESVDVPPGGRATARAVHRFDASGEHTLEVRLGPDVLELDNHRWASVPVRPAIRALCVAGKQGAADFVALALQPSRAENPRIEARVVTENALLEEDVGQWDCIFLCNVARVGADDAGVLRDYVAGGGGLAVFVGDQTDAESYNRYLGPTGDDAALLPARIGEPSVVGQYRFQPRKYEHPIVAPFRGHVRSGLLTTPVWKYLKLKPVPHAATALWLDSGDAAIVEHPFGQGRVILVATAASDQSVDCTVDPPTPFSALARWPSFPPLVQRMLDLVVAQRNAQRNVSVGAPLSWSIGGVVQPSAVSVALPDGQTERVWMTVEGQRGRWSFDATRQAGLYQARYDASLAEEQTFAVNVDTRESDLSRVDPESLPAELIRGVQIEPTDASVDLPPRRADWALFRILLTTVLTLLFVETFLAWRFAGASR